MSNLYWLDDNAWASIQLRLPTGRRGAHRVDDRRVISGNIHILKTEVRWRDCPKEYGPYPIDEKHKIMIAHDPVGYRERNHIERIFYRLKDFRRIATRDDKRADIFLSAVCLAAIVMWWV